jgi:hypothetical protein
VAYFVILSEGKNVRLFLRRSLPQTIIRDVRFAQPDRAEALQHLNEVNALRPFPHLLRERALCAIGIVLHTKVFVDLEQPLLVRDRAEKLFSARIISKKTRRGGFQSPVR